MNLVDSLQFYYYIILMFKMEGKKMFLTNKIFCLCPVAAELRDSVHHSVKVYVAKNSRRIHITYPVDLECLRYRIFDVIDNNLFFERSFRYQPHQVPDFIQQSF